MNWAAIGLAAVAGAVSALIAMLLVRKPNERRVAFTIVFVATFTILNFLAKDYVLPRLTISAAMERAEQQLLALPAFPAMKQHDPAVYDALMSDLRAGILEQQSEEELLARVKPRVEQLVQERVPLASDDAVVAYMRIMIREMRELNRQDPDLCYKLLFPQQYGAINAFTYLPKDLVEADSAALAQVIRTSAESPQLIPDEAEIAIDLSAVVDGLWARHGENTALLQDLHSPTASRELGCNLVADLYDGVLALPLQRSSKLLRYLLAQE